MKNRAIASLTLALLFATFGCGGSGSPPGTANSNTVKFTQVYSDILSGVCLPCHAPGGVGATAGGLDMSNQAAAYANLRKSAVATCSGFARVVPGDSAKSLLVEKVESAHPPCGTQMPYGCGGATPCLSATQVQEIANWINDGAKND